MQHMKYKFVGDRGKSGHLVIFWGSGDDFPAMKFLLPAMKTLVLILMYSMYAFYAIKSKKSKST